RVRRRLYRVPGWQRSSLVASSLWRLLLSAGARGRRLSRTAPESAGAAILCGLEPTGTPWDEAVEIARGARPLFARGKTACLHHHYDPDNTGLREACKSGSLLD